MTLATATPRGIAIGNGTRGPFTMQDSDGNPVYFGSTGAVSLRRYSSVTDEDGTALVYGTDFTLTGIPGTGVTFTLTSLQDVLASTERIVWKRTQNISQLLSLTTGGNFSSSDIMARLDQHAQYLQDLRRDVDRKAELDWRETSQRALPIAPTSGTSLLARSSTGAIIHAAAADFGDGTAVQEDWLDALSASPDDAAEYLPIRQLLTANREVHWDASNGDDTNDGTSGNPVLTQNRAKELLRSFDLASQYQVKFYVDDNITETLDVGFDLVGQALPEDFEIIGSSSGATRTVAPATGAGISLHGTRCRIRGFSPSSADENGMKVWYNAIAEIGAADWPACSGAHLQVAGALARRVDNWTTSGDAAIHYLVEVGGHLDLVPLGYTDTAVGTRTFSDVICDIGENSMLSMHSASWPGTWVGTKYRRWNGGEITPTTLRNTLPGSVSGTSEESYTRLYVGPGDDGDSYGNTLTVVGSAGEVAAVPSSLTNAAITNAGHAGLAIHSEAASVGIITFGRTGVGNNQAGYLQYSHNLQSMTFGVEQTIRMTLDAAGALNVTGEYQIDGNDVVNDERVFVLRSYTVATLPNVATHARGLIYVSDETGGATLAFSNGTNWKRVSDLATVA